jgi:hypothetical protein
VQLLTLFMVPQPLMKMKLLKVWLMKWERLKTDMWKLNKNFHRLNSLFKRTKMRNKYLNLYLLLQEPRRLRWRSMRTWSELKNNSIFFLRIS